MKLSPRAAIMATFTFVAIAVAGATTPGLAFEPDISNDIIPNVQAPAKVPTPPMPIVPAEWTDETPQGETVMGDDDSADASADIEDFATLAAAVAAQDMPGDIDSELNCLAIGVYFESKGEPLAGQLAVAEVILNRAGSGRFPKSVCSVLTQRGQFSFVRGGKLPGVNTTSRGWRTAVAVAQVARDDHWDNPVPGALFFHARYVSPGWRLAKVGAVGNHIFYR